MNIAQFSARNVGPTQEDAMTRTVGWLHTERGYADAGKAAASGLTEVGRDPAARTETQPFRHGCFDGFRAASPMM